MGGVIGGIILFIIVVSLSGTVLARESARAWDHIAPGTRPTRRQAAGWSAARARSAAASARTRYVRARRPGFRGVRGVVLNDPPAPPAGGTVPPPPARHAPARHAPAPPPPPAAQQPAPRPVPGDRILNGTIITPTGRTNPVSTPAVASAPLAEDIIAAYTRIRAVAVAGNINDKQAAYAAMSEACDAAAGLLDALASSMEDDSKYGPEITEAARGMAAYQRACARAAADTEEQISSLAKTPLGELPESRHQAPERSEMLEAGGR